MKHDELIAKAILDHLNSWQDKPCNIRLETMEKAPTSFSISMQQLSGTVKSKSYIDGSFVGFWPFAVFVRFGAADTAQRLNAVGYLQALDSWLCDSSLPDIGSNRRATKFEMTSLPSLAAAYEDGGADYHAVFRLVYNQRSV